MTRMIQGQEITVRFSISSLLNGFILVGMMGYIQYKLSELDKKNLILEENLSTIKNSIASLQASLKEEVSSKAIEVPTPIVIDKTIFSFFYDNPYIAQTLIILIGGVVMYYIGTSISNNTGQPIQNAIDTINNSGTGRFIGTVDKRIGDIGSYISNTNVEQNLTNIQGFDTDGNIVSITFDTAGKSLLEVNIMPKGSDTYIPLENIVSHGLENGKVILQSNNIQELLSHQENEIPFMELFNNSRSSPITNSLIQDSDLFDEASEQVVPAVSDAFLEGLNKMNEVFSTF